MTLGDYKIIYCTESYHVSYNNLSCLASPCYKNSFKYDITGLKSGDRFGWVKVYL